MIIPHSPNSPPRARFGQIKQFSGANRGTEFSIGGINNCDADRVRGHHRLVEVRPDIPQLCYIARNYFMYYLTVPVYLLRD